MHGAVTILQAMLIMLIAISLVVIALPWVLDIIGEMMDISEIKGVKTQLEMCDEKIIETSRTGSVNKCLFSVSRGELTGSREGINYKLISFADVCDRHPWVLINEEKHLWQKCDVRGDKSILELRWNFPKEIKIQGQQFVGNELRGDVPIGNINFGDEPLLYGEDIVFRTLSLYVEFEHQLGETGNLIEISRVSITAEDVTLKIKIT